MKVYINGEEKNLREQMTLEDLVAQMKLQGTYYAIALNDEVIPKSTYNQQAIKEGDSLEIVKPVGGG